MIFGNNQFAKSTYAGPTLLEDTWRPAPKCPPSWIMVPAKLIEKSKEVPPCQ